MDPYQDLGLGLSLQPIVLICVIASMIGFFVVRRKIQKPRVDSPSQNALRHFRRAFVAWLAPLGVLGVLALLSILGVLVTGGASLLALFFIMQLFVIVLPASLVVSVIFIVMGFVERSRGVAAETEVAAAEVADASEPSSESNIESSKEDHD